MVRLPRTVQVHCVHELRGELEAAQRGRMPALSYGTGQKILVVIAAALFLAHTGMIADNGPERLRIGEIPTFDMQLGAGGDDQVLEAWYRSGVDFLSLLRKRGAIAVDTNNYDVGTWRGPFLDKVLIQHKLTNGDGVSAARDAHLDRDVLLSGDAAHQRFEEHLVCSIFDKHVDDKAITHQAVLEA